MRITIGHLRRIIREVVEETQIPGASEQEINDAIERYSGEESDYWDGYIREQFLDMSVGGNPDGLRNPNLSNFNPGVEYPSFKNWRDEDFKRVVDEVDMILGIA